MKKTILLGTAFCLVTLSVFAQDNDLLKQVEDAGKKKEYADYAFKSTRVIMSHSMELLKPGTMDFRILHRSEI
jgi:hypothetical protein